MAGYRIGHSHNLHLFNSNLSFEDFFTVQRDSQYSLLRVVRTDLREGEVD